MISPAPSSAALADVNKTACDHRLALISKDTDKYADAGPAPLPPLPQKTGKKKQLKKQPALADNR